MNGIDFPGTNDSAENGNQGELICSQASPGHVLKKVQAFLKLEIIRGTRDHSVEGHDVWVRHAGEDRLGVVGEAALHVQGDEGVADEGDGGVAGLEGAGVDLAAGSERALARAGADGAGVDVLVRKEGHPREEAEGGGRFPGFVAAGDDRRPRDEVSVLHNSEHFSRRRDSAASRVEVDEMVGEYDVGVEAKLEERCMQALADVKLPGFCAAVEKESKLLQHVISPTVTEDQISTSREAKQIEETTRQQNYI